MLLIAGLDSYERLSEDRQYHALLREQSDTLARELDASPHGVLDDYPHQAYSVDVLLAYAVAAGGAGAVVGRFGQRARSSTAPAGGALAGALLVLLASWKGAPGWPLLVAAATVFVGGGALFAALGARLGRKRRR